MHFEIDNNRERNSFKLTLTYKDKFKTTYFPGHIVNVPDDEALTFCYPSIILHSWPVKYEKKYMSYVISGDEIMPRNYYSGESHENMSLSCYKTLKKFEDFTVVEDTSSREKFVKVRIMENHEQYFLYKADNDVVFVKGYPTIYNINTGLTRKIFESGTNFLFYKDRYFLGTYYTKSIYSTKDDSLIYRFKDTSRTKETFLYREWICCKDRKKYFLFNIMTFDKRELAIEAIKFNNLHRLISWLEGNIYLESKNIYKLQRILSKFLLKDTKEFYSSLVSYLQTQDY